MPTNASIQNGKLVFFTVIDTVVHHKRLNPPLGYVICNEHLEAIDTFVGNGVEMDAHDIYLYTNGSKAYFEVEDTLADVQFKATHLNKIANDNIEIIDAKGNVVFHWNPYLRLGINSMYPGYCCAGGRIFSNHDGGMNWARGSSLCLDFDGNILYSYRGVGIGKISVKDGSLMWRIDRNTQKLNEESDIIPIYMQHDFKSMRDAKGRIIYTLLSNGDETHDTVAAYQFTVEKNKQGRYVAKLIKKIMPSVRRPATLAGNYDIDSRGRYILNYGFCLSDTSLKGNKPLFEFRDKDDKILNRYESQNLTASFRAHEISAIRPTRPQIIAQGQFLTTKDGKANHVWFQLYNDGNIRAERVGVGAKFKPRGRGSFCVTSKYGVGYAVSDAYVVK